MWRIIKRVFQRNFFCSRRCLRGVHLVVIVRASANLWNYALHGRLPGEFHCCQVEGSPVLARGASMEQCSICLEALDGGVVALAACGHRFHAACLAQMAGAVGTATTRRGALTACPNCRTVSRVDPVMPVAAFSIGDRVSALWGHKWFPGIVDGVIIGQTRRRRSVSTRPTSVCSSTIRRVRHGVRRSRHGLRVHCRQKSASALRRRILALFGGM